MRAGKPCCLFVIALTLTMSLAACGRSGEKSETQVVARVNGEEITVHQLNQALSMMEPEAGANPAEASKSVLENIINQTIGVQAAVNMKLDRDPMILRAMENAKRLVLLDAYLERSLKKTTAPTSSEIHEYFSQHPDIFANRRIYVFNQLAARAGKESVPSLSSMIAVANSLSEFIAWLKARGVDYSLVSDVKPSEQLPMGMLAQMRKLKAGDLGYLSGTDGVLVIEVVQIIEEPLTEQQARPLIERYLADQKQMAAARKLFEKMRANARVEYLGEFKSDANPKVQPQEAMQHPGVDQERLKPPVAGAGYVENGVTRPYIPGRESGGV